MGSGTESGNANAPATVKTSSEIKSSIDKYKVFLDDARNLGAEVGNPGDPKLPVAQPPASGQQAQSKPPSDHATTAQNFLLLAIDDFENSKLNDAYEDLMRTAGALSDAVSKLYKVSWWKGFSYKCRIYSVGIELYAIAWLAIFGVFLIFWPLPFIHVTQTLGLPAWAGPLAGAGGCIQILVGVVADVQQQGYSEEYRRMWYNVLPPVAFVFGCAAYMLFKIGLLSLGTSASTTSSTSTTFLPMAICFLAGYSTKWFMSKLDALAPGPSSTSS